MRFFLLAGIVFALILAGCSQPPDEPGTKDCGVDVQCFQQAASESCGPAKVSFDQKSDQGGLKAEARIKPGEAGNCVAFLKVNDVLPPADADEQTNQTIALIKPSLALASMDCRVTRDEAADFQKLQLTENDFLNRCSGLLVDLMKQLAAAKQGG